MTTKKTRQLSDRQRRTVELIRWLMLNINAIGIYTYQMENKMGLLTNDILLQIKWINHFEENKEVYANYLNEKMNTNENIFANLTYIGSSATLE